MSRGGFALLAVLWVLTALASLTAVSLAITRLGAATTRNRVLLARAEWAREACGEILLARYARDPAVRRIDSVDLGRGTWCQVRLDDPAAKLNINAAEPEGLAQLLGRRMADSIIALRRRGPIDDVRQVGAVDTALVTTDGTGVVNVTAAPRAVLATLPGMTEEAVLAILGRRESGRPITSADELAGALSRSARAELLEHYPEFVRIAVFAAPQLVARVEGGVGGTAIVARALLVCVPIPSRLAVIRRETE